MPDLAVDVDALETFGGQLDSIRTRMNAARDWTHQYDGQMGASQVEDALHSFSSGWKDGRTEIDGSLQALSEMLTNAAQNFRQADADLAKPLQKK
ncbi:hypothetical protein [Catenulispora pinisilvae]|uniref:hypothetical protein n=1 Tax=Catenulispora pinisilvae TaxID=2705253 RepID=UPI0018918B65|nr:hypothetical protein [Catenulispora pinisilvae]